ncbi:MAG: hypothetical protein IJB23_07865 [Alistipes sp.]|nr:hypothetical protein [Alistipes sp.]MBQ7952019.1 hypothetical protein [Alistipes sp.]
MAQLVIAIDFDGTCVTHEYPYMGSDIGAVPVLKELTDAGYHLVLNTMRSGKTEKEAVKWFKDNDIPLYGVNKNPDQKSWSASPKVYADLYIDDSALGVPLTSSPTSTRPYVDWIRVREWLVTEGYL